MLWLLAGAGFLVAAEAFARLDDLVFHGVPFLANPRYEDLFVRDELGRRGRPNAQFGKWKLNSDGFRGPDITPLPRPGCTRIAVMGASETFGYDESPGHEFPALLGQKLAQRGCVEVVNVAVVGMTTGTMVSYWNNWVSRFHPDLVLVYSSPLFYLGAATSHPTPPAAAAPVAAQTVPAAVSASAASAEPAPFESRFIKRLRGVAHAAVPSWVWMRLNQRQVAAQLRQVAPDALIHAPPAAGLADFGHDLAALIEAIRSKGSQVALITHAQRAELPVSPRARADLWEERSWVPQADLPVFIQFDRAANEVTLRTGAREDVQVIDAAAVLNGCWDCFGDLNHFIDKGSERMADVIAAQLVIPGKRG